MHRVHRPALPLVGAHGLVAELAAIGRGADDGDRGHGGSGEGGERTMLGRPGAGSRAGASFRGAVPLSRRCPADDRRSRVPAGGLVVCSLTPMKAGWSTRSLVVAASLLAGTARAGPGRVESPTLNRGQVLELSIAPTPDGAPGAAEFLLAAELEGPLVIEARSFDHDVVLQRMASDGRLGETADNGGIGWNARLDVQARAAEPVRMQVVFKEPLAGRVEVEILDSSQALPEGFALGVAIAQWKLECGRAAERRGDETSAISAYSEGGQLSYHLRLYADCRTAFEALQPLAEKQHDAWLLCVCQGYLGAVTLRAGDAAAARPVLSSARDGAVAQQQGSWELFCQSNLGEACQRTGDLVSARTAYERALFIARALHDTVNEVNVLSLSAELSILEGDAEEARKAHDHAVTSAEALDQPDLLAQALTSKGRFLRGCGQASDAEAALLQALRVATLPALKAGATGELGNVRLAQGRWP
ncbi:MAG TPA: tetratricopeptide repeat protein, partial [Planctomycetota bacterium]|nr:tetratricopeptide repeat protein [Planctomycetota bacterium]